MYPVSSQKKNWTFSDEEEIDSLRRGANERFIEKFGADKTEEERKGFFLSPEEEVILLKGSELILREFCRKFSPPMPKSVIGTSYHYFKRFYINNSVMDYHPKEILVTCVYLACKVEEFNISIVQFVSNIRGDREKAAEIILNNELLLMQQLNYYLTVHNPFRPVEGLIIDIKTRYPQFRDPERLRPGIDEFIDKVYQTDVVLLYSPSQIALAAVLHGASNVQENLDLYVTKTLFGSDEQYLARIIEVVRNIRLKVKMIETPGREITKPLEDKLSRCRNQENNPDSEMKVRGEEPDKKQSTMAGSGNHRYCCKAEDKVGWVYKQTSPDVSKGTAGVQWCGRTGGPTIILLFNGFFKGKIFGGKLPPHSDLLDGGVFGETMQKKEKKVLHSYYKRKKMDLLNEEDERQVRKYAKISERMRNNQNKFFGITELTDSPK